MAAPEQHRTAHTHRHTQVPSRLYVMPSRVAQASLDAPRVCILGKPFNLLQLMQWLGLCDTVTC